MNFNTAAKVYPLLYFSTFPEGRILRTMSNNKKSGNQYAPSEPGAAKKGSSKVRTVQNRHNKYVAHQQWSREQSNLMWKQKEDMFTNLVGRRVVGTVKRRKDNPTDPDLGLTEEDWDRIVVDCIKQENEFRKDKRGLPTFELKKAQRNKLRDNIYEKAVAAWESIHVQTDDGTWTMRQFTLFLQLAQLNRDDDVVERDGKQQNRKVPQSVLQMFFVTLGKSFPRIKAGDRIAVAREIIGDWGVPLNEIEGVPRDNKDLPIKIARFLDNGDLKNNDNRLVSFFEALERIGFLKLRRHQVINSSGNPSKTFVLVDLSECPEGEIMAGLLLHVIAHIKNLRGDLMYNIGVWEERSAQPKTQKRASAVVSKGPVGFSALAVDGDETDDDEDDDATGPAPEQDDSCTAVAVPDDDEAEADADEAEADDDEAEADDDKAEADNDEAEADTVVVAPVTPAVPPPMSYASLAATPLPVKGDSESDDHAQDAKPKPKPKRVHKMHVQKQNPGRGRGRGRSQLTLGSIANVFVVDDA